MQTIVFCWTMGGVAVMHANPPSHSSKTSLWSDPVRPENEQNPENPEDPENPDGANGADPGGAGGASNSEKLKVPRIPRPCARQIAGVAIV